MGRATRRVQRRSGFLDPEETKSTETFFSRVFVLSVILMITLSIERTEPKESRLFFLQLGQGREHFFAVLRRFHPDKHLRNLSLRIDDESVSRRKFVSVVFANRAICFGHFHFGIGEEFETEALFGAKPLMRFGGIDADSEDHGLHLFV